MKDLIRLLLPGRPEYLQAIKLAVGSLAGTANFNMEAIEDIKIAVAEASKNISCHGYEGYSRMHEVDCQLEDDRIIFTVKDVSAEHDLVKQNKCMDCPHEGDLGLHVMKSLMDEVDISKDDTNCRAIELVKYK